MLDFYSNRYGFKVIIRDFNMKPAELEMNIFLNIQNY